jgi:hypothetical protein
MAALVKVYPEEKAPVKGPGKTSSPDASALSL